MLVCICMLQMARGMRSLNVTANADLPLFYYYCLVYGEANFSEIVICLRSIESSLGAIGIYLLRIQRTMPKDIVSKFCFFVSKCGQQVDIKGTIRDSYLFEVD